LEEFLCQKKTGSTANVLIKMLWTVMTLKLYSLQMPEVCTHFIFHARDMLLIDSNMQYL